MDKNKTITSPFLDGQEFVSFEAAMLKMVKFFSSVELISANEIERSFTFYCKYNGGELGVVLSATENDTVILDIE